MKIPTFHHGGRIGDLVYSLYTMERLAKASPAHTGNIYLSARQSPGWDLQMAQETVPFLKYQDYINDVFLVSRLELDFIDWWASRCIDYDLVDGERTVYSKKNFPEWKPPDWPGDVHIAKRYAVAFDLPWQPNTPWLRAPSISDVDIVFHAPLRRLVRPSNDWKELISVMGRYVNIYVVDHLNEWEDLRNARRVSPKNLLETATYINSCKLFLGASSSGGALAEGLGKPRFIELCEGGKGQHPTQEISNLSVDEILGLVYTHVNET